MTTINSTSFRLIVLAVMVAATGAYQARPNGKDSCSSASECGQAGMQALKNGDTATAVRFFREQVGYAEDTQDRKEAVLAYNSISDTYLRDSDYFRALAWTTLALRSDPENATAKNNVQTIQEHNAQYRWSSDKSGLYIQYAGRAQWNSFCIHQVGNGKLDFRLLAFRMNSAWRTYGPASYGEIGGRVTIGENQEAPFHGNKDYPSCHLNIKFSLDSAQLSQDGDCGFGYGVRGEGDYQRITEKLMNISRCGEEKLP
jgi:hypothetical protein